MAPDKALFIAAVSVLATACAWTSPTPTQSVAIEARDAAGQPARGALCTVGNDFGAWTVVSPGEIRVPISRVDLTVECKRGNGTSGFTRAIARNVSPLTDGFAGLKEPGALGVHLDPVRYPSVRYAARIPVKMGASIVVDGAGNVSE